MRRAYNSRRMHPPWSRAFSECRGPLVFEIERDGALVGCMSEERRPHVAAVERLIGAGAAALVWLAGMLDLDYVGTEHGQLISRKRPSQHVGDVDHPDALERSLHRVLPDGVSAVN